MIFIRHVFDFYESLLAHYHDVSKILFSYLHSWTFCRKFNLPAVSKARNNLDTNGF